MEVTKSPADSPDLEEATLPAPPGGPSGTASAKEGESNTPQLHFGQHFLHVWYGLPSAAKATLLLAVVSTLLLMAYAIVGLTDSGQEEDHIAAVIIIMAVFNMYAVSDAVIFENTLQLLSSLVLSSLMLARVLWFIGTKQSTTDSMLPVVDTLGALNSAVVLALIVAAAVSARQFGWRLYSRLNVDHRNKGAESLQRLALVADAFNTLVKVDMAFIVTLIAVGLDAALEKQTQPQYSVIALSIIILVLCTSVAVLGMIIAFKNVSKSKGICMLRVFDMLAPLSCGGPIALMVVYHVTVVDAAKAWTTIVIACCVVIATTLSLWAVLHVLLQSTSKLMFMGGGVTLKSTSMSPGYRHDSAVLAPLRKGEWLGKPSHRNPRKIRFFQLSHDETTLRWGWKHFVRLYYVQDLTRDNEMLTITLTFVMDKELTLRFPDKKMLSLWYDGLQHVSAKLLTPSVPEKDDGEDNTVYKGDDRLPTKKVASRFGEVGAILTAAANAVGWRQDKADGRGAAKKTFSISSPRAERNHHFTVTVATQTEDEDFAESSSQKSFQGAPTNEAELADQYAALMELAQSSEGRKVEPGSVGIEVAIKVNHDNHRNGEGYFKKGIESSQEQQQYFDEVKVNSKSLTMSVDTIDYRNLQLGQLLGSGAEGTVHAAWYLDTPVALKRFNRLEDSLHELGMYLGLGSHDNIVALRALCNREDNVDLVLEYCPRGTLDALLHHTAPKLWEPVRLLPLIRSIARGMNYLHSRGIVHRDLKPANIFVAHGLTMKIGDFGMARYVVDPAKGLEHPTLFRLSPGVIGTPHYAAPELINDLLRPQGAANPDWAFKIDIWSFGVTLWEILERKRPFEGQNALGMQILWLNSPYQSRLPAIRVPEQLDATNKRVCRGLTDLVDDCTRVDPMARPSFDEILRRLRVLMESQLHSN